MFNGHNKFLVTDPPVAVGEINLRLMSHKAVSIGQKKSTVEIVAIRGRVTSNT